MRYRADLTQFNVKITQLAEKQLSDIFSYISKNILSKTESEALYETLKKEISSLTNFPTRHPVLKDEFWKDKELRKMTVDAFSVYYTVNIEGKTVFVTSVVTNLNTLLKTGSF